MVQQAKRLFKAFGLRMRYALGLKKLPQKSQPVEVNPRDVVLQLAPEGGVAIEIGVFKGGYSRKILDVVQPRALHLIDPWQRSDDPLRANSLYGSNRPDGQVEKRYDLVREKFAEEIQCGRVVIHRAFSDDVHGEFEDGTVDFVYVDGDHSYEGASNDIRNYWPKLKPGGIMAIDDYEIGGWWRDGVVRAANEALRFPDALLEYKAGLQFVIRKRDLEAEARPNPQDRS